MSPRDRPLAARRSRNDLGWRHGIPEHTNPPGVLTLFISCACTETEPGASANAKAPPARWIGCARGQRRDGRQSASHLSQSAPLTSMSTIGFLAYDGTLTLDPVNQFFLS